MTVKNIELLRNLPVFHSLSPADVAKLAEKAEFVAFRKGELIVTENQQDDSFYVVVSGRCQAFTRLKSGATRVVSNYCSGDCFGEIVLLVGESHWHSVRCLNDAVLLRLHRDDFNTIVHGSPDVLRFYNQILQDRIKSLREEKKRGKWSAVIVLYGIRPGVGKRLVVTNLAASLNAETHEPVLVVDLNNKETNLDLTRFEETVNWSCADISSLVVRHPAGYDVLTVKLQGSQIEAVLIPSFFGCLVKRYDYVLVDLPADFTPPIIQSFIQCDEAFLVTGKEEASLDRSQSFLRDLGSYSSDINEKVRVILTNPPEDHSNGIDAAARRLGHPIHAHLTRIGNHEADVAAVQKPFVLAQPIHPFSLVITRLARSIGHVRVGLALGSGAARGLAHIGVIRVLEQAGIIVDVVSGASMGSLIAAAWASGRGADEMEEIANRINTKRAFFSLLDFTWGRGGLIKGKRIEGFLRSFLGEKTFADALIDLRIIATDLNNVEELVFSEGSLVDAVRASIAIPGVVTPVRNNGHVLIDGGITSPVPIGVLERMGVSKIIAVDTIPHTEMMREYNRVHDEAGKARQEKKHTYGSMRIGSHWQLDNNIMDINMRAMHAMQSQIAAAACANADVVIRPVILDSAWYEFYNPEKYIRKGEESANEALPALKKLVGR